jgi:hypothetical protein
MVLQSIFNTFIPIFTYSKLVGFFQHAVAKRTLLISRKVAKRKAKRSPRVDKSEAS